MGTLTPFRPLHFRAVLQLETDVKTNAMIIKIGRNFFKNLIMF